MRMYPKKIVSTSHQNFNNSTKIAAENSWSSDKIIKQSLKTQKNNPRQLYNKLAFNIFYVVPNFANILTTVVIVKIFMQAKRIFIVKLKSSHLKASGPR